MFFIYILVEELYCFVYVREEFSDYYLGLGMRVYQLIVK